MKKLYLCLSAIFLSISLIAQTAGVQVIHNSPTPGTTSGPTVDIYVNGALLPALTAVEFRQATSFLDVPAGVDIEVAVAVSPSNSVADAIATFGLGSLADGGTYVVTASGIVGDADAPFNLFVEGEAQSTAVNPDNVEFSVFHGSPDAPAVDIAVRNVGTIVPNISFGAYSDGYISVPPAAYIVDVKPAGASSIVASYNVDLSGLAGNSATVFASGLLGNTPGFGIFAALSDGTVVEFPAVSIAAVQVIHNSPTPGTTSGPTVDIYVNGGLLPELTGVEYRQATGFLEVPGDANIEVAVAVSPSNSVADAIATFDLGSLANGGNYVVTAAGVVGDPTTPFDLYVNGAAQQSAADPDNIEFSVFHGSSDAPAVDIAARTVGNLVSNVSFGEYTGNYLSVAPGLYYIDVKVAGDENIVATFEANLNGTAGLAATVFASGLLSDTPGFGIFAALADGTVIEFPAAEVARLQLVHNSPTAGTAGGPTVDVYVNGALYEDDFVFQTATEFRFVPAGVGLDIAIAGENSTSAADAIVTFPGVTLANGGSYVVFANGIVGDTDNPFTLAVQDGIREAGENPEALDIIAFHGSPGAPNVDLADFVVGEFAADLAFGEFTGYVELTPNAHVIEVRPAGAEDLVGSFFVNLTGGGGLSAVVFASGLVGDTPAFNLLAVLPDGTVIPFSPAVQAQVIHNSPLAAAQTIDLYLGNQLIVDDLSFREATPFQFFSSRVPLTFGIAPSTSTGPADILFNVGPLTLEDGKIYTLIANGIPANPDFPLEIAVNDMTRIFSADPAKVDIAAFHGSPGAPGVDIVARGVGDLIDNLTYGNFTDYLSLDPDNYYLEVRAAGSPDLVATFDTDIQGLDGFAATVFASGILGDTPAFGLFAALPDGTVVELTPVCRAQLIHNAPEPTVDIYINGVLSVEDFTFRSALPYLDFPTRQPLDLAVTVAGEPIENAVAVFEDVVLEDGKTYSIIATGIVNSPTTGFDLAIFDNARERSEEGVDLLLYHGAPTAPDVDVVLDSDGTVLFDDIAYGQFDGYLNVPASSYVLNVTPADDNATVVRQYDADLSSLDGEALTVFASGFLEDDISPAFQVWVARANGETFPLSELVGTNDLSGQLVDFQLSPNPASSFVQVAFELKEAMRANVVLYNAIGQVVFAKDLGLLNAGVYTDQLQVSDLPAGTYQYVVMSAAGIAAYPLIVNP